MGKQISEALERKNQTDSERLIRLPAVMSKTGLSRSMVYDLAARGEFPRGINLTRRTVAWPESAVDGWIAARIAAADVA